MTLQQLSSANPRVKRLRKLISSSAERHDSGEFVVEGPVLCAEAHRAGIEMREIFCRGDDDGGWGDGYSLVPEVFDAVASTDTPRSPMAVCGIPESVDLNSVQSWVMVADGISDPGNLGTIIRSAEAAGAAAVVVTRGTTDPWSPKCVRAAAGSLFHVPIVHVDRLEDVAEAGFDLVGTTSHSGPVSAVEMHDADFDGRVAVVLGNEARGLPVDAPVARWVTIAHAGRTESLNVAMAGTVIAMHIRARRGDSTIGSH